MIHPRNVGPRRSALLAVPLFALTILGAGLGCGRDTQSEPDAVLGPHTKVLDEETLSKIAKVADDRSTITLTGTTAQVDGLAPGDVIVASVSRGTPVGLLRRVTSVDKSGGGVTIVTANAQLTDAFERAHVTMHRELGQADLASSSSTQTQSLHVLGGAGGDSGLTIGVNDLVLYDADDNPATTHDQARVSGSVSIHPSIDLTLDIDGFSLKEASFSLSGGESASLDLVVDGAYTFDQSKVVPAFAFAPIVVPIAGVPLVFEPKVDIRFGAKGALSVKLDEGATQSGSFTAGVGYKDGSWGTIHSGDLTAEINPPQIDGKVSARTYAGPEFDLLLYGMAGPYVNLTGYLQLDADIAGNPCWALSGGLDAHLGVKVDLLGKNVVDYDAQVGILEKSLTSGPCSPTLPPDTFWSKVYSSSTSSPENVRFAPTLDGGFLVVGHSMDLVMKIDAKGNVLWQHDFTNFRDVRSVIALADGTYVAAGSTRLVKLDATGTILWSKRYSAGSAIALDAHAVVATKDGGFFLTGTVQGPSGYPDVWAMKTDGNGTPQWSKRVGSSGIDSAEAVRETSDGHLVVVGTNGDHQGMALSLDASGALTWQWQYGGLATVQSLESIASAPNGGFLLAGTIQEGPSKHGWLVRTGADGTMQGGAYASIQYLPSNPDDASFSQITVNSIAQAQAGGETYFGTGTIWDGKSTTTSKLWSFRVTLGSDGTANMDWSRGFDATGDDEGYAIGQLGDGTLLVGGTSQSLGTNVVSNLWFLRTQQNGAITFPGGSPVTQENLSGQIFQSASSTPPDGGTEPVPVVSSQTSLASSDVAVTPSDDPLAELPTSVQTKPLAP